MSPAFTADPTEVWVCSQCGGDYHAKWECPVCGAENECLYWESQYEENRVDITGECKKCGVESRITGKYPED